MYACCAVIPVVRQRYTTNDADSPPDVPFVEVSDDQNLFRVSTSPKATKSSISDQRYEQLKLLYFNKMPCYRREDHAMPL